MKNMKKLVALFAATTMAMSLSVSAFAASYADGTLTLEAADFLDTGAQKTMMAYVVAGTVAEDNIPAYDATAGHTMIALNQDADLTGNVLVDADAVTEGSTIVIKTSGSNGSVNTILLAQEVTPVTYNVTYANVTDATDYPLTFTSETKVADFFTALATAVKTVGAPTKEADEDYTYEFSGDWATTADGTAIDKASTATMVEYFGITEGTTGITLYALFTATAIETPDPVTILIGDVDNDGYINMSDAAAVLNHFTKDKLITDENAKIAADVDADTYINMSDAAAILNHFTKDKLIVQPQ